MEYCITLLYKSFIHHEMVATTDTQITVKHYKKEVKEVILLSSQHMCHIAAAFKLGMFNLFFSKFEVRF